METSRPVRQHWAFDAALAERAAQELLAVETATKPARSPATRKSKKGKHKKATLPLPQHGTVRA